MPLVGRYTTTTLAAGAGSQCGDSKHSYIGILRQALIAELLSLLLPQEGPYEATAAEAQASHFEAASLWLSEAAYSAALLSTLLTVLTSTRMTLAMPPSSPALRLTG